jgi:hypothetical protein
LKLFKAFSSPLKSLILALSQTSHRSDHQRCCSKRMFPKISECNCTTGAGRNLRKTTLSQRAGHVLPVYVEVRHHLTRCSVQSFKDATLLTPHSQFKTCSRPLQSYPACRRGTPEGPPAFVRPKIHVLPKVTSI